MKTKEEILKGEDPTVFLTKCAINFKFFCEECVGDMNGLKIVVAPFHMEWFSALQKNKRIAIQAPTGMGKTGILAICYPIWLMMFRRDFRILVVSTTLPQSRKIIEEVKHTIEQNEMLADLIPAKDIWTKEEINTNTNCKMICKPYNINVKGYHTDFLLCVPGKTTIETQYGSKKIKEITIGEKVISAKGNIRKVKKVFKRKWSGKIYEIDVGGSILKLTGEHPVLISNGKQLHYRAARRLKIGDECAYPSPGKIKQLRIPRIGIKKLPDYLLINEEIAELFGYYVAEGSLQNKGITFTFGSHEIGYIERVSFLLNKYFGGKVTIDKHNSWATNVIYSSVALRKLFMGLLGKGAKNKKIPKIIFDSPKSVRLNFLHSAINGDGCWRKEGGATYGTISKQLSEDFTNLLTSLSIASKTFLSHRKNSFGEGEDYQIYIGANDTRKIRSLVNGIKSRNYIYRKINSIKTKRSCSEVYNLEVEKDNSYIANGVAVHNCDEAASFVDTRIYYDYVVTRATSRNGTICCISTPESINDLMAQLHKSDEYWSKIYPAEKDGIALWPERFPIEWLGKRRKEMRGEPGAYEREYLCDPSVSSGNNLYPPYIIANTFDEVLKFTRNLEEGDVIGAFDFAIATGPTADYDAYVILERTGSGIFLRYGEVHKGLTIEAKARRIKALKEDYKIDKLIIDPNNVGQGVKSDLLKMGITVYEASFQSMARSKMLVNLRRLMGDPNDNIKSQLFIPRNKDDPQTMTFTNRLIDELLGFQAVQTQAGTDTYQSKAKHDDTVMALAMGCSLISDDRGCLDFVAVG